MTAMSITGSVAGGQRVFWRPSAALRVATRLRPGRHLAVTLVAAICAFALLLTVAPAASSLDLSGPESGVAAQTDPAAALVGAKAPESPVFVGGNGVYSYDGSLGCCVAPTSAVDDVVRSADDILTPGGTRIGTAGSRTSIREVSGGLDDAQALFTDLSQGGTVVTSSSYPGTLVQLPNGGGTVGIRTTMTKSPGTIANIDVNIPGIDITKIKFN